MNKFPNNKESNSNCKKCNPPQSSKLQYPLSNTHPANQCYQNNQNPVYYTLTGPQGDQGPQGLPGRDGRDGRNGKDGQNGRNGVNNKSDKNGKADKNEMNVVGDKK